MEPTTPWQIRFARFMEATDRILVELAGCTSDDLPDFDYAGYWDCGISPARTAAAAIEAAATF